MVLKIINIPKAEKAEFLSIKNGDIAGVISSRSNNRETRKNYAILTSFGLNIEKIIQSIKIEKEKTKCTQESKSKVEIPKSKEFFHNNDSSYDDLEDR